MSCDQFDSFLTDIEEYIFDEKKIVTCGWLSKHFNINSNIAKQLLHTFYENNPKKEELCVTYLVIGLQKDEKTSQISIVTEKDLKKLENNVTSITSKHVYSIQRCLELSDVNVLYAAQKGESVDTLSKGISAISFDYNERDNALIDQLRFKALSVNQQQPLGASKKASAQPLSTNKSEINNVAKNDQCCKSPGKDKESETKSDNKKVAIPSMFKNSTVAKKKPTEKVPPKNKNTQAIGNFFSKVPNKLNVEPKVIKENENGKEEKVLDHKAKETPSPLKENKANLNICNDNKSNSKVASVAEESPVQTKKLDSKPKAKAKSGKKKTAKPVKKDDKKRKRLVVLSDSESNNSSADEEEVNREPTPEPEPTVVPDDDEMDIICGTPEPQTRKRKKKLVTKTFTTSEGYMVTEKSYVDASCSDEEEAVPEKKFKENPEKDNSTNQKGDAIPEKKNSKTSPSQKKGSKNKIASPQKTKQASLMSFFKKK